MVFTFSSSNQDQKMSAMRDRLLKENFELPIEIQRVFFIEAVQMITIQTTHFKKTDNFPGLWQH